MSESIFNALVHLFALIASLNEEGLSEKGKLLVKDFLKHRVNQRLTQDYFELFNNYLEFYLSELHSTEEPAGGSSTSLLNFQAVNVCRQVKKELNREDRIVVFIELLQFVYEDNILTPGEEEVINVVADEFRIGDEENLNFRHFVFNEQPANVLPWTMLVVDNKIREWSDSMSWFMKKKDSNGSHIHYAYKENLYGKLLFLHIPSVNKIIFRFMGEQNLYLESRKIESSRIYFFNPGSIIKGPNIKAVYYQDISNRFYLSGNENHILFAGNDLQFRFMNSSNGIHPFNFCEGSGSLVGILGGSGVGKSTLLQLLNGKLKPGEGSVTINGFNLHKHHFQLKGIIGFVPQDDLLIEELSVFQNLYFNASLCFADYTKDELKSTVERILRDLDLTDIAHLKVGSPLNKYISGGQRKRLNIGLELMREPYILILDEPTSGLSSSDSEKIIQLLKDQTRKGRLVIATIHQPSSHIYKMLDKLWILDKGGYPVYSGNPVDAIIYFKKINAQVDAAESECPTCGNVNTEQILKIIESRTLDDNGLPTQERKISPKQWFEHYREKIESGLERKKPRKKIPENNFKIPSPNKQLITFAKRNILSKLANTQYMFINLLEAPLLAVILAWFTKYTNNGEYIFQANRNFPIFLFMSVVVAFFLGLTVSAEEIVRDRKILERESFLNLSWPAYLGSKIGFLFVLSAFQTLTFILISSFILDIKGMLMVYWLILFTTSVAGNLIGLNISSALDSVVAIYILIPLILVPQLLLGGAMIPFDDLNEKLTNKKHVPLIGDMMITRWSYEAMAVEQFMDNKFNSYFYELDQQISTANYYNTFLIPNLQLKLENAQREIDDESGEKERAGRDLKLIHREFEKMAEFRSVPPFEMQDQLLEEDIEEELTEEALGYLYYLRTYFTDLETETISQKDLVYERLVDSLGEDEVHKLREDHLNNMLSDLLMNRNSLIKIHQAEDEMVRKLDPVYIYPHNRYGRAQFFAPYKLLGYQMVESIWFNMVVLWSGTILMFFLLVFDVFRKIVLYFTKLHKAMTS